MRAIFGEYLPDQPPHLNQGLLQADGCIPIANGYAPFPSSTPVANGSLGEPPRGGGAYRVAEDTFVFVATATAIKRYQTAGYTTVGSPYVTSPEFQVRFAPYNTLMLATNGFDPIQSFDPGVGTFADLSASAPAARFLAVVRGFVVAGYTDDESLQVAWSDSGDPTVWNPGSGDAGFAIMPSGGDITGVVGGEYGLVFQENRVVRMDATGDDLVWQFNEISADVGCIAPKSIATFGRLTFFMSNKGLMVCDGVQVTGVGTEKVDRTFLALSDRSYFQAMSAAIDPRNSLYMIAVPAADPSDSLFVYNFALQRFTTAPLTTKLLFPALAQGVTLEDLDAIYGYLDTMPLSLDSPAFRGGLPLLLLFDGSNRLASLSGANLPATFMDTRREIYPGQKARVRMVRPLSDAGTVALTLGMSNNLAGSGALSMFTAQTTSGVLRTRAVGNYVQTTLRIPAGTTWTYMQGFDLDAVPGGRA